MNLRHRSVRAIIFFSFASVAAFTQTTQPKPPPASAAKPPARRADRTGEFLGLGVAPDAAAAARGEKLFGSNCAFCHGAKATGAEGPDLVRSPLVLHDNNGDLVGQVLAKGRPDKGMPAFPSVSSSQVSDIAAFLHMRIYDAANRGTYQVQDVVTGNAKAGEAYFNGAGKCSTCHSVTGDLAHVASRYEPASLQAAFLYPASVTRLENGRPAPPPPVEATVTLPTGESVTGKVKRLDDFSIELYDSSGAYHSWAREPGMKIAIKDPLAGHRELLDKYSDTDMHNLLAYLVTLK